MFAFFFILILLLSVVIVSMGITLPTEIYGSKKTKHAMAIIDVTVCCGLLLLMVLHASYADSTPAKAILIPCISVTYCLFHGLVALANKKVNLYISFVLAIAITMLTIWISTPEVYTHNVSGEYKISITNSIVSVDSNITLPKEANLLINEEAENMKKFGATYYEGNICITYTCNTPKYANEHGKACICSSAEICTICSKYVYVSDVELSKKNN